MQQRSNKPSKKKQVEVIRAINAGEDVSTFFKPSIVILFAEMDNMEAYMINGKPCTIQEYEQAIAKANFKWVEEKQYPEPLAALESDSLMTSRGEVGLTDEAANEPVINPKQYLEDTLKAFDDQEKIDLELRNRCLIWQRLNSSI